MVDSVRKEKRTDQLVNQPARASLVRVIGQQVLENRLLDWGGVDVELEDEEIFRLDDPFDHVDRVQLVPLVHGEPDVHERVHAHEVVGDLPERLGVVQSLDFHRDEPVEGLPARVVGVVEPLPGCGAFVVAPDVEVGGAEVEVDIVGRGEGGADAGVGGWTEGAVPGGKAVGAPLFLRFDFQGFGVAESVGVWGVALGHYVGFGLAVCFCLAGHVEGFVLAPVVERVAEHAPEGFYQLDASAWGEIECFCLGVVAGSVVVHP